MITGFTGRKYFILLNGFAPIKKPDNSTFEDLISEIEGAITKTFRDEEEYVNSDEYIIETIEAN